MENNSLRNTHDPEQIVLSIMILTRNRTHELLKALHSCVECALPEKTEFVIVDNASQESTKEVVDSFFHLNLFEYHYRYLSENVGPAAGRNEGLTMARGRYVYFMDDDAYIDSPKHLFFEKMINFLNENDDVFCVTTWMRDTALNDSRPVIESKDYYQNRYKKALWFHGGSFLVDRQRLFNQNQLFLEHQFWGMEELYPSLKSYFNNFFIVEMKEINVIHDPSETRFDRRKAIALHYTGAVHVKLTFYPLLAYPFVYFVFCLRVIKHLGLKTLYETCIQLSRRNKNLKKETVPLFMFWKLVSEFGFRAIL